MIWYSLFIVCIIQLISLLRLWNSQFPNAVHLPCLQCWYKVKKIEYALIISSILNCQRDLEPKIHGFGIPVDLKCLESQFVERSELFGVSNSSSLWVRTKLSFLKCLNIIGRAFLPFLLNKFNFSVSLLYVSYNLFYKIKINRKF